MRTVPYDIQTNMVMSRKVVGMIFSNSKNFIPRNADDLVALGEENYTDGIENIKGNIVFHLDSKKANFHVDICSEMVPTSLYNSKPMEKNLMEFLSLHDFHRTKYARRSYKNGRTIITYCK